MHDFDVINLGSGSAAILFCKKCGTSYVKMTYAAIENEPGRTVWERVEFQDYQGTPIDLPCKRCSESEEYSE